MYEHFEQMVQSDKECIKWNKLAIDEQIIIQSHPHKKKSELNLKIRWYTRSYQGLEEKNGSTKLLDKKSKCLAIQLKIVSQHKKWIV